MDQVEKDLSRAHLCTAYSELILKFSPVEKKFKVDKFNLIDCKTVLDDALRMVRTAADLWANVPLISLTG